MEFRGLRTYLDSSKL